MKNLLRFARCTFALLAFVGVVSCGQAVSPRWVPPDGHWSPLVGRWDANFNRGSIQVISGNPLNGIGREFFWLTSVMTIQQIGPTEFEWAIWPGDASEQTIETGHYTWTMTVVNGVAILHPGEVSFWTNGHRIGAQSTMVSGGGTARGNSLSLQFREREFDYSFQDERLIQSSLTAVRVGNL